MRSAKVRTDGSYIRWAERPGPGPARVYLHGLGSSSAPYYAASVGLPPLSRPRSLLIDLLGFGISDRPAEAGYSMADHADHLAAALTAADVTGGEIVGHCMGGVVAVHLAARHPHLVAKLVLVDALVDLVPMTADILGYTEAEFKDHGREEVLSRISPSWSATMRMAGPEALYRSAVSVTYGGPDQPDVRELLRRLTIPCTNLVPAEKDAPVEAATAWFRTVALADCGHNMMVNNPEVFAAAVAAAFAGTLEEAAR